MCTWTRRHAGDVTAVAIQVSDAAYRAAITACGGSEVIWTDGETRGLAEARDRADEILRMLRPHDCRPPACEEWTESRG